MLQKIMGVIVAVPLLLSTCFATGIKCRVTSYTASKRECGKSDGFTASGVKVRQGMVSTDWRVFPPGTVLHCDTTREIWVAGDRGGGVHSYHIDRYVPSLKQMRNYCGGFLMVSVLYKPNSNRKTAHQYVDRGFFLRGNLVSRGIDMRSSEGLNKARRLIASLLANRIPRNIKELREKERPYTEKGSKTLNGQNQSRTSDMKQDNRTSLSPVETEKRGVVIYKYDPRDFITEKEFPWWNEHEERWEFPYRLPCSTKIPQRVW
jgi:3D (Asp-Asp-Asp) domain-containing protein